jgi:hypothetical protein
MLIKGGATMTLYITGTNGCINSAYTYVSSYT